MTVEVRPPRKPRRRGTPNVENTKTFRGFFQARFLSSGRRQFSESVLWDLGVTALIIIRGGGAITESRGNIRALTHATALTGFRSSELGEKNRKGDGLLHTCNAVGMQYGCFQLATYLLFRVKSKTTWDTLKRHKYSTGAEALNLPTTKRTKLWKIRRYIMRRQDHLQINLPHIHFINIYFSQHNYIIKAIHLRRKGKLHRDRSPHTTARRSRQPSHKKTN